MAWDEEQRPRLPSTVLPLATPGVLSHRGALHRPPRFSWPARDRPSTPVSRQPCLDLPVTPVSRTLTQQSASSPRAGFTDHPAHNLARCGSCGQGGRLRAEGSFSGLEEALTTWSAVGHRLARRQGL